MNVKFKQEAIDCTEPCYNLNIAPRDRNGWSAGKYKLYIVTRVAVQPCFILHIKNEARSATDFTVSLNVISSRVYICVCFFHRHSSSLQLAEHPDGTCADIIQKILEKIRQLSQQKSPEGGEAADNEINLVRSLHRPTI